MAEKFNLNWNDFHINVSKSFAAFRNEKYLHDVTLLTDDYHQVTAHKFVLSVSSEYFQQIFKNANNLNLLVCLDGVNKEDLLNCLNYMYFGEVQIYRDNLDRFFNIAQRLKLQGLQSDDKYDNEDINEVNEVGEIIIQDTQIEAAEEENIEYKTVRKEKKIINQERKLDVAPNLECNILNIEEETDKLIERLEDGHVKCTVCGKVSADKLPRNRMQNMRYHVERHFEGLSYNCQDCNKVFRSKHSLQTHKSAFHRG